MYLYTHQISELPPFHTYIRRNGLEGMLTLLRGPRLSKIPRKSFPFHLLITILLFDSIFSISMQAEKTTCCHNENQSDQIIQGASIAIAMSSNNKMIET